MSDRVTNNVRERAMAPVAKVAKVMVFVNIVNTTLICCRNI